MMRNAPVVLSDSRIGFLQSVCFDPTRKTVCALIVAGGLHGKRIVRTENVHMIADGFILVNGHEKYHRERKQQMLPFVRDVTGRLAGRVTDYAVGRKTLDVIAIEVTPGYLPAENRNKVWVYAYSYNPEHDELSMPIILHGKPYFSREEIAYADVHDEGDCCRKPDWTDSRNRHDDDAARKEDETSAGKKRHADGSSACRVLDWMI